MTSSEQGPTPAEPGAEPGSPATGAEPGPSPQHPNGAAHLRAGEAEPTFDGVWPATEEPTFAPPWDPPSVDHPQFNYQAAPHPWAPPAASPEMQPRPYPDPRGQPWLNPPPHPEATERTVSPSQLKLSAAIGVATMGSLMAWALSSVGLDETGFYFITLPGVMAALLALVPRRQGSGGALGVVRTSTIVILCSALVIREGFICVLMALPLIVPIIAIAANSARNPARFRASVLLPLLLLGLGSEGVAWNVDASGVSSESRIVAASPSEIEAALAAPGELPAIEPLLFKLPFPLPHDITSEGLDVGDQQVTTFTEGQMVFEVIERSTSTEAGQVRWKLLTDTTPIAGWTDINEIEARWQAADNGSEVTMSISYDRKLAPSFYFGPLMSWGTSEMADVLLDMVEENLVEENLPADTKARAEADARSGNGYQQNGYTQNGNTKNGASGAGS